MTRSSNRSSLPPLFGLVVLGCSSGAPALEFPTTTELPDEPRRAPGVAVDPSAELPSARVQAPVEQGVVVLEAPADPLAAREVVREFFRAMIQEQAEALDPIVEDDAWVLIGSQGSRQRVLSFYKMRLGRLDYEDLAGRLLYRESEVETYEAADVARLGAGRHPPLHVEPGSVAVRVPIATPRAGRLRLFADEVWFLLRPSPNGWRVAQMVEDFQVP